MASDDLHLCWLYVQYEAAAVEPGVIFVRLQILTDHVEKSG